MLIISNPARVRLPVVDGETWKMHSVRVSKPKKAKPSEDAAVSGDAKSRVAATDPKSRKQRAARALANHPRAAQILDSVDFRDPTPREREIAASLKDRARKVRSRHAAAA